MAGYPEPLCRLIDALAEMPGIGERTAERLAFHVLKQTPESASELSEAITEAKRSVRHCKRCFNLTQKELCSICDDETREQSLVCVVESPRDLVAIEKSGTFHGVYHCLLGRIAALEGIDEQGLTVESLVKRCERKGDGRVQEVILATNPNLEGDATALAVARALESCDVKVTRLARGVPVGYELEYLSGNVMQEALDGRRSVASEGRSP